MHLGYSAQGTGTNAEVDVCAERVQASIQRGPPCPLQGRKAHAHAVLMRALQLGALLGLAVGVSQAAWCLGPTAGAAALFTRDPTVLAEANPVLLLIYACMVRAWSLFTSTFICTVHSMSAW